MQKRNKTRTKFLVIQFFPFLEMEVFHFMSKDSTMLRIGWFQTHKMGWPFLEAVDPNEVPDYYDIVKDPMGRLW